MHTGINRDIQNATVRVLSSDSHQSASTVSASAPALESLEDSFAELMGKALSSRTSKNPHKNISHNLLHAPEIPLSEKKAPQIKATESTERKNHPETPHLKNAPKETLVSPRRDVQVSSFQKEPIKQVPEISHEEDSLGSFSQAIESEKGDPQAQGLSNNTILAINHTPLSLLPQALESSVSLETPKVLETQPLSASLVPSSELLNSQDLTQDATEEIRLMNADSLRQALSHRESQRNAAAQAVHIDVLPPPIQSERPRVENLTRMMEDVSTEITPALILEGQGKSSSSSRLESHTSGRPSSPNSSAGTSQNVSSTLAAPSGHFSTHFTHAISPVAMTTAGRDTPTPLQSMSNTSPSQKEIASPSLISGVGSFKNTDRSQSAKALSSPSLSAEILQQIKEAMKKNLTMVKKGETHLHLTLNPKELGEVSIRLNISEAGKVNAAFSASHPEALDILSSYRLALKEIFEAAGLDTGQMNFFMGGEQGDQSSRFHSSQGDFSSHHSSSRDTLEREISDKTPPNRLSSYQIDVTA